MNTVFRPSISSQSYNIFSSLCARSHKSFFTTIRASSSVFSPLFVSWRCISELYMSTGTKIVSKILKVVLTLKNNLILANKFNLPLAFLYPFSKFWLGQRRVKLIFKITAYGESSGANLGMIFWYVKFELRPRMEAFWSIVVYMCFIFWHIWGVFMWKQMTCSL